MIQIEVTQFWMGVAALIVAWLCAGVGAVWTLVNKLSEIQNQWGQQLNSAIEERDRKISRVYERLDEEMAKLDLKVVRKDLCNHMHESTVKMVSSLDEDYKNFRHEIRNAIQKIATTAENHRDQVHEMIEDLRRDIMNLILSIKHQKPTE